MTTRTLRTRLVPELAWPGHHRKSSEKVGEAVADLHRLTLEAFADVPRMDCGFVIVTLYTTKPKRDGFYRPRLPWMVDLAVYPIFQALQDAGLLGEYDTVTRRREVETREEERIEVELSAVEERAA
jgi:hypothetical protein